MGQRSRKRGRRSPPPQRQAAVAPASPSRSEQRNAEVRAGLIPLAPGERPWAIQVSAGLAALVAGINLVAWLAGMKISGKHPAAGGIVAFTLVMVVCAVGLWQLRYWAVLGFMALLGILATLFALFLTEASNILGVVIPIVIIAVCGFLFWKLVRVLSRIQMPKYPGP